MPWMRGREKGRKGFSWLLLCSLLLSTWLLTSCQEPISINITGPGTPSPTVLTSSDGTSRPLDRWLMLAMGVELRYEHWKGPSGNEDTIMITRFDPRRITLRVLYSPSTPHFISDWLKQEKGRWQSSMAATSTIKVRPPVWSSPTARSTAAPTAVSAVCSTSITRGPFICAL